MERQEPNEKIKGLSQGSISEIEDSADSTSLHQALAEYAIQHAGTDADLDLVLEAAAIDDLTT